MTNINNLSKLLKNLSTKMTGQKINLNPTSTQKQEQSSLNNETLNFNNGKLDKNDPYGGLIKLSGNLQNPKNTKAGLNSSSLSKLLKNLTQNNSVKTVKPQNTNQTTNTTQNQNNSPAFGSLEYILNLMGQVTTSQDGVSVYFGNYETRTDSQGRVIYMTPKTGIHNLVGQTSYSISYGENNQVTIAADNASGSVRITTYDASGKVIKTETKNVGDWKPIEVPTKIPAGEKGSKEYVLKLLNIDEKVYGMNNKKFTVEQTDELGRATKINRYHQFPNLGGEQLPQMLEQEYDISYNQDGSVIISTRYNSLKGEVQAVQTFDSKDNLVLTKETYQNGNYSEVTNNQMTLFDTNGNSLVNVLVGLKTYDFTAIDGEKITLIYENGNSINFNAGDKVIIDYTGKVTVQTSANEIKTYDKDGNELNKIEDGKIGSLSYVLNILGLPVVYAKTTGNIGSGTQTHEYKNIKTDSKGRVVSFDYLYISSNSSIINSYTNSQKSYTVSYGDNNEISVTPYESNMQGGTVVRSTYNAEGRLVKEETVQKGGVAQVSPFDTKYINSDGSYTIIEFDNNGNVKSVKNYDKDGNEI